MDTKLVGIGVKMRKGVIFTIRVCFGSVCNHPFLVGMLCFLILLYRSCPFIFSLLLSASPILLCTAILLGTLLSYGEPNIPEIELEERTTHVSASMEIGLSGGATVLEESESFSVERFSEKNSSEQPDLPVGKVGVVLREELLDVTAPFIKERSRESQLSDVENWDSEKEFDDSRFKGGVSDVGVSENHYGFVKMNDELFETDDEKSEAGSFDSEGVNVDSLDSLPRSPWKRIEEQEGKSVGVRGEQHEGDGDEDAFDSDSDQAESSSPDASIADIMPMLDELHPLLDEEASQLDVDHDGSDAASERSSKPSSISHESDDETENPEDLEAAEDENDNGEDEEDALTDKDEHAKSAITWTEEDQKNLMDLGSSEMERNQRLENLIWRRRARKNLSMIPERNLIDLESPDLPYNVAPILTRRQNPFDLLNEHSDESGLPPIPGSAPSVLLPRRNPFDIPYDSGEEKPNLMGDGFQEELVTFQLREQTMFRRHESFHVGPSVFAPNRQEARMHPYFVPERTFADGSAYSPFQRQSSGLSDSKVSSIPETESLGSVEDMEEKKLSVEDYQSNIEVVPETKEVTEEGPSVDHPEIICQVTEEDVPLMKEVTEEGPSMEPELISQQGEVSEEDVHQTPRLSSKIDSVSEYVGHGSQSSSSHDSSELVPVDTGEVEELENAADHNYDEHVIQHVEIQESGYRSGSSSLSEESERVFTEREIEGSSLSEEQRDTVAEVPVILTRTELSISCTFSDDNPHREPVYDSSPRGVRKNFSSSSISSDVPPEADPGLPPVLVKRTVSFVEKEYEDSNQEMEMEIPCNIEILPESSITHPVNESRPADVDVVDVREYEYLNTDSLGVNQRPESEGSSAAIHVIADLSTRSNFDCSPEENIMDAHGLGEGPSSSADKDVHHNLDQVEQGKKLSVPEKDGLEIDKPPSDEQVREEIVQSPESDTDLYHEASEKLITTPSAEGNTSLFYDKAIHGPIFRHHSEFKACSRTPAELSKDVRTTKTYDMPQFQELDQDFSSNANSPLSPDFISIPSTVPNINSSHFDVQTVVEKVDQINEIDEGLLSELDSIGDFSVKQPALGSSVIEKHIDTTGVCSSSSACHAETSSNSTIKADLVELDENKEEDVHSEDSRMEYCERDSDGSSHGEMPPEAKILPEKAEAPPDDSLLNQNTEDTSVKPETEVGSSFHVDCVLKNPELVPLEAEILCVRAETSDQGPVDMENTSALSEVEASSIQDIDLAFISAEGIESKEPVVLQPPPASLVSGESMTIHFEDGTSSKNLNEASSAEETLVLGVAGTEDSGLVHDHASPVSQRHNAEHIPPEVDILHPKQELVGDREKQMKPKPDDKPLEIEAEKEMSSAEVSSEQGNSISAAEKTNQEVESPKELHSSKSVERKSKSSGSSSSSTSSDSSSSDSDKDCWRLQE